MIEKQGEFLILTKSGKFIFITLNGIVNSIRLPFGIDVEKIGVFLQNLLLPDYRKVVPDDYNFLWDDDKMVLPNEEVLARRGDVVLISNDGFLSDMNGYKGRIEIRVARDGGSRFGETIAENGHLLNYFLPIGEGAVITTIGDVRFSPGSARKYAVVRNSGENIRLSSIFWQIVEIIIGDDSVVAISESMPGEEWRSEQLYIKYKLMPIYLENNLVFEDGVPRELSKKDRRIGYYFKDTGLNFVGVARESDLVGYAIQSRTFWLNTGMELSKLPILQGIP